MAKTEMVNLGEIVDTTYSGTNIDEKLIAKFLTISIDELDNELKAIDSQYDKRFELIDKDMRTLFDDWIKDKRTRRKFLEELIKRESNLLEKEKLLNNWFKLNSEIDGLCLDKKDYLKNCEIKLVEEKTKKEKRALTVQIAKALVPVAVKGILFGLNSIANRNNINSIDTSVHKITKK